MTWWIKASERSVTNTSEVELDIFFKMDFEIQLKHQETMILAISIGLGLAIFLSFSTFLYIVCTDSNNQIRFCLRKCCTRFCYRRQVSEELEDVESNYFELMDIA